MRTPILTKIMRIISTENREFILKEVHWLQSVIDAHFQSYFAQQEPRECVYKIAPPSPHQRQSAYENAILGCNLTWKERLAVALALAPLLQPQLLDRFFTRNQTYDRRFTEFGGVVNSDHSGFLPTGETLLFLLAGDDLQARLEATRLFDTDHVFARQGILRLESLRPSGVGAAATPFSGVLRIGEEFLDRCVFGREHRPEISSSFPARKLTTELNWNDAVLHRETLDQLADVQDWIRFGTKLRSEYGMSARLRPGCTCLFYGPPGTGKTLTATLLGKESQRDVYRIDLSLIVSKWVGETEKNLARIFDQAEGRGWVLFFDEADALFGKRSEATGANDRYANQEVAYLLQRIEEFDGLAILASNMKGNIDPAFTRRFQSIIHFPIPSAAERLRLWKAAIPGRLPLQDPQELASIAERYEISGGMIVNVVQYCAIKALKRGDEFLSSHDLQLGLKKELLKEGYFPG